MERLRALEIFVEVSDRGSLAAAARSLSISPPTVTRVLSELESSLGVVLLRRTTRAVVLTQPGERFLQDARQLLQDYEEACATARGSSVAPRGVLRLTAPVLFGQHFIAPVVLEFLTQYPDMQVDAVFLDRTVNLVEEGFDVAIRIGSLPDSTLMARKLGEVRKVVCASPDYLARRGRPTTPRDLADHEIVCARTVTPTDRWAFHDGVSVATHPRVSFSAVSPAIEAAEAGWGVTRVLSYQLGASLDAARLEIVLSDFEPPPSPVNLVHSDGRRASAKVRAFADLLAERASAFDTRAKRGVE